MEPFSSSACTCPGTYRGRRFLDRANFYKMGHLLMLVSPFCSRGLSLNRWHAPTREVIAARPDYSSTVLQGVNRRMGSACDASASEARIA